MNDDKRSCRGTEYDEDKPILALRVFRIMEKARVWIAEGALSFFKPHTMLDPIPPIFPFGPLEAEHFYILYRCNIDCKGEQEGTSSEAQAIELVDVTGFEPATPCLQSRCSPS